jgi:hypothetical protein
MNEPSYAELKERLIMAEKNAGSNERLTKLALSKSDFQN